MIEHEIRNVSLIVVVNREIFYKAKLVFLPDMIELIFLFSINGVCFPSDFLPSTLQLEIFIMLVLLHSERN